MSKKHQLKESVYVIMKHSRDGSYATPQFIRQQVQLNMRMVCVMLMRKSAISAVVGLLVYVAK